MLLEDLPTPCLLIEKKRLEANIRRMQEKADTNGVQLRPHTKTHKSIRIARLQQDAGARGITVAKTSEAAVYVRDGFDDVRIASTVVGEDKWARIAEMMSRARVSFCVDTLAGVQAASSFFHEAGVVADVLMEVDTGHHRCGVDPESDEALEVARAVTSAPGLRLIGILTHAGHGYHGPREGESPQEALQRVAAEERDRMLRLAARLAMEGIEGARPGSLEISIGSTPTLSAFENATHEGFRVTEIRPGNYVFNDMIQVGLGVAGRTDCALTVWSTAISRHRDRSGQERLYLDAGKKVLTSDVGAATDGFGTILFNSVTMTPLPHARIVGLSEEHGWVRVPGGATIEVGETVRVVPNHACVVVNTQDRMFLVDGDKVVEELRVDARGMVQ